MTSTHVHPRLYTSLQHTDAFLVVAKANDTPEWMDIYPFRSLQARWLR